jgi:hypothetical protein
MGKNAIQFDHHGRCHHHTAAMGPHSWQQSIQQSTNMICNRSTSLKLEKKLFITINMTIIARPVDDDNATTIASLALLPPLHCCLPCDAALLASLVLSCPLQCFLAPVPRVSRNVSSLVSLVSSGPLHHRLASFVLSRVGNGDDPGHEYRR